MLNRRLKFSAFYITIFVIIILTLYFFHKPESSTDFIVASYSIQQKIEILDNHNISNKAAYEYIREMYGEALHHSNMHDENYAIYEKIADQNLEFYILGYQDCSGPKITL